MAVEHLPIDINLSATSSGCNSIELQWSATTNAIDLLAEGVFARAGAAYLSNGQNMVAYAPDEMRQETVLSCSISDGEIRFGEGIGGASVVPHCQSALYMFGLGTDGHIYRSTDGATWNSLGHFPLTAWLFTLNSGTLLRMDTKTAVDPTVFRSTDNGENWEQVLIAGTTENFVFLSRPVSVIPWGMHQAQNGTIVMVEYLAPHGARYIYRSVDDGTSWTTVHDGFTDDSPFMHHYHAITKHEGLGRWIATVGDYRGPLSPRNRLVASDDDGATWHQFTVQNELFIQPTWFLDYGHPSRLLFGSDMCYQAGWIDISDGPQSKALAPVITNWDRAGGKNYCWLMFEHAGLYYACHYDNTDNPDNTVISVSPDTVHWTIYHRFSSEERGPLKFAGYAGGKLHLAVVNGYGQNRHLAISPAHVAPRQAAILSPPNTNLLSSIESSSAESVTGWQSLGDEIPAGSGYKGDLTYTTTTAHHGTGCIHYTRSDGGNMYLSTPKATVEPGRTYQARMWLKGSPGRCGVRSDDSSTDYAWGGLAADEWQEFVAPTYTVPSGKTTLSYVLRLESTSTDICELYVDSLQIEEVPTTLWQQGGQPRPTESLEHEVTVTGEWTNIFTIRPDVMSEHLVGAGVQHVKSYIADSDNYVEVYFSPADARFKAQATIAGVTQPAVETTTQHFQRHAQIRVAARSDSSGLMLSIANGQPIETAGPIATGGLEIGSLTVRFGSTNGLALLPSSVFDDFLIPKRLSDTQLAAAFIAADLPATFASDFQIIERSSGGGGFAQIDTVSNGVLSYTDDTVVAGTSYTYRLKAARAAGESDYSNEASATHCVQGSPGCDGDPDADGVVFCADGCPVDPDKSVPGICGCGLPDVDSDADGTYDCDDACPNDQNKTEPGLCGCGTSDGDSDGDNTPDCLDQCPNDPDKTEPGYCGCGSPDTDSDGDHWLDCIDGCPADPGKIAPGFCGCGSAEILIDSDNDGALNCNDLCPGFDDNIDSDGDTIPDGCDLCDDTLDTDADGVRDCVDICPGFDDNMDSDGDTVPDGCDLCDDTLDTDVDGVRDCIDQCPSTPWAEPVDTAGCAFIGACCTDYNNCLESTSPHDCTAKFGVYQGNEVPCSQGCFFPGDYDGDADADLNDFLFWDGCMTGPASTGPLGACDPFDIDQDGDVDFEDFGLFQLAYEGAP